MRRNIGPAVRLLWTGLLVLLILGLAGCRNDRAPYIDFSRQAGPAETAAATAEAGETPIRIALASVLSPQDTIGYYRQVARYVSQETGRPVVLIQRKTYEEVNLLLANEHADIAFLSTGAYGAYRGMAAIEMLVMQEYQGSSSYMTDVIVHRDSNIRSIDELRGKVFAFTDPLSYSGHMVIAQYLRDRRERPENYFGRYIYTYNHDKSFWAVATKVVDAACLDSMITEYAAARTPELAANVRVIHSIGPAPTGPLVISQRLGAEQIQRIRDIFLSMHKDPVTRIALQNLLIDRFVPPQPALYEPLRRMYDRTGNLP